MLFRSLILLVPLLVATGAAAADIATARKVSGDARYKPAAAAPVRTLEAGAGLSEGATVFTGKNGWVEILLADGSVFTVANNSEFQLSRFASSAKKREGVFTLAKGKLRANVVKLAGQQADFTVRSATAVAGIKGTDFLMLTVGPANVFFGTEGSVAVAGAGSATRPLLPDTMTQTTRGHDPMEPVKVEPATPLATALSAFRSATGATPPEEWLASDALPEIIARWNVNHARYLSDSGKYDEALHVFQAALDLTADPAIRSDALLERGAVQGRFLNNPRAALGEYLVVLEEYAGLPQAETALFHAGQALTELGQNDQAKMRFRQYLERYPEGRYRSNVETLLKRLGE